MLCDQLSVYILMFKNSGTYRVYEGEYSNVLMPADLVPKIINIQLLNKYAETVYSKISHFHTFACIT